MTAYLNGHTIHQHRYHGDTWYTVDERARRFTSTASAAQWVRERLATRGPRQLPPVPSTQALRRQALAA